jgi:glycosyltransferase involved in cell wall biosynthesis
VDLVAHRVDDELARTPGVVTHRVFRPGSHVLGEPLLAAAGIVHARRMARRGGVVLLNGGNCPFSGANWVHYVHAAFEPVVSGPVSRRSRMLAAHRLHVATERLALRRARILLANSERTRDDIIHRIGVDPGRVSVVYLGVDREAFRVPTAGERALAREALGWRDPRPRVVFIGELGDRRKGLDVVYEAWRSLCGRSSWDAELVVVGRGAELPEWQERAARDGVASRIAFLGFRKDIALILAASDALVAPTRYEPYGLGVHEALCRGLPALVSASAGVAERYPTDLSSLLLREPESASGLTTALLAWRDDAEALRRPMADFAARLGARTWDDMARDIARICDDVVEG